MKTIIPLFLCCLLHISSSMAQDTIVFLSGRVMYGTVKETDSLDVKIEVQKRKKKKMVFVAKNSIFAIKYSDGKTEIFYEPLNSEDYSIREMELFVKGEQDALRHTKAPLLLIGGVIVGGASMVQLGPFYGLLPLVPYALVAGSFNTKIKESAVSNPDLLREDTYITGYVTKAKNVKIQKAMLGSIIGYLGGLAAIVIITQAKADK